MRNAVILLVFKQPGANVIQTVEDVKAAMPRLAALIPPGMKIDTIVDRTQTIRASVADVEFTLALTIGARGARHPRCSCATSAPR